MPQKKSQPKQEVLPKLDSLLEPLNEEQADKVAGGFRRAKIACR